MLVSYQWLREIVPALPDAMTVADALTRGGLEVERVEAHGENLAKVKLARVVSTRPHPTSKNPLTLVTVDIGSDANIEVVCGAPNVPPPGGIVCFAPLGTEVFDKKGGRFVLEAKPIAGIVSQGMLCAEDELGLGSDHAGILVLREGTAGHTLAEAVPGLVDWIFEVNVTPNRPDALGHIGVARDAAALLGLPFRTPEIARPQRVVPRTASDEIRVQIDDATRCPRYDAALVRDVHVGPSPLWARTRLHRLGVRPINNVVDVTNLVMLEYGQPLHGFDLDVLAGHAIVVRPARNGEKLQTLDGQTRTLTTEDLVIADAERAIALAGVMGGEGSGITERTARVLLESAYFEPRGVRRTAKRHGMHSEASHRFERDVDLSGIPRALARAAQLLADLTGGALVGEPIDLYPQPRAPRVVSLRLERIQGVLGVPVSGDEAQKSLRSLGFEIAARTTGTLDVTVPLHRPDVTREIDLIEEVGRVHGLGRLPSLLPPSLGARAGATRDYSLRRKVRETCVALGLDEAISYSFIAPAEARAAGFGEIEAARITNPLSEERSILRPSLLPRLLGAVSRAQRYGVPRVRLFEVGTVFALDAPQEPGLLNERTHIAMALAGPRDTYLARPQDVDFFDAKGLVEALAETLTLGGARFHTESPPPAWAHPRAYAAVEIAGRFAGVVAELHPDVRVALDLPRAVVVAELDADALARPVRRALARAPGRFPSVRRDVALLVERSKPAGGIADALKSGAGALCDRVELFDRYEGKELPEGTHSLAYALWFRSDEATLTDEQVDGWTRAALASAASTYGVRQR